MSVLNQSGEEQVECPLCLEPLEVDDLNFFPCTCGYQICRFCWHRIRTDENGLCPACRKAYSENPADFKPLSQEEVARLKAEKRQKDQQRKQKITENRKHLANIRVVQQNLVFVVGLPMRLADSEVLKKHEYFGKFGKIQKVVINQSTSYAGSQGPSASAYVTYLKADDALRAIQAVNNISVDGRTIKTSLGTTKYCSNFMKNQPCLKPDCMYLHELGDPDASFTKEEMQQGKHQEYEKKLHEQLLTSVNRDRKPTPSPPAVACQGENSSLNQGNQSCSKEAWPSLQPGLTTGASGNGNGTFGLANGTGNTSTNNSSNGNNTSNNNSIKAESSQRKQRFDQQTTKIKNQKIKGTSGEEGKGKLKDKCPGSVQDELGAGTINRKSEDLQHSNLSFKDCSHGLDGTTHHPSELIFGSTSDEADVQENNLGNSSSRQITSRILLTNHTSTLFEPDNNSFFSTNNFTKVSTTIPGPGTTDWLPLTHMPDVLPPVHSSEDWQAAFGFADSACPTSQHQESSCVTVPMEKYQIESYHSELCSKTSVTSVEVVEADDQEQSHEKKSSLLEQVSPYPIQVLKLGEEIRLNSDSDGCLTQNIGTGSFGVDVNKIPNSRIVLNPPCTSNSADISQQTLCHSTFVQDPTVIMLHPECHIMSDLTNHIEGSQHVISNGLLPLQTASKFFADIHLRQQSQHNNSTVFESANLGSNISGTSDCCKFSVISDTNLSSPFGKGQGKCIVNNRNEFLNGSDNVECILKDKYHTNFHNHQHKHLEPEIDLEFKFSESSPQKLFASSIGNSEQISIKDGGRLTDDELGFDPFHETQKALAEMMEKENMMVSMQNKQSSCYMFHNQQNHVNQLSSSKFLNAFNNQNHHILPQQNNRLSPNISSCTKLLNGLGIGPSSVTAARTRLPPPGFTTAPNHMNAFGLGIPRAPSSSCSKILPFMGLGNSSNCSPPPVPQTVTTHPQHQGVLFPTGHTFGLENASGETLLMKDWPENFQPLLNSQNTSTPPPPPVASFGSTSVHGNLHKGWNGTDWTALDPAIVSSTCPPNFLAVSHSANLGLCSVVQMDHEFQQSNTDHCRLYSNSPVAPPPPGFSTVSAKNQNSGLNANMGKIEIPGVTETKGGIETSEEDQLEGLR